MKSKRYIFIYLFSILLVNTILAEDKDNKLSTGQTTAFSFEDAAINFPSLTSVKLNPGGRFYPRVQGNSIYINFFESSEITLTTGSGIVRITQNSEFPERGKSNLTIKAIKEWKGELHIRIPSWARDFQFKLNGNIVSNIKDREGYCIVNLEALKEFQIEIKFEIPLVLEQLSGNDHVMRRGPEVLSIDVRDNIDTWLGEGEDDDLITIPKEIALLQVDSYQQYQWAGPIDDRWSRRRYLVYLDDKRTSEPRGLILTPYADAGNEGAAFRSVFPLTKMKN